MRSLAVLILVQAASAANPVFLFDSTPTDRAVFPVIEKYLQPTDFVSARDYFADPALHERFAPSQQFDLLKTLSDVQSETAQPCKPQPPPAIWFQTLAGGSESASIATALRTIHAAPCHQAGILPSAQFWGYRRLCEYDLSASPYLQLDWTQVDRVIIQGEGFLNPACRTGIADYQSFLTSIAGVLRARNPRIVIYGHASFRFTPAPLMISGIQALGGLVDGFLISYPLYGDHLYCTADNVEAFFRAFRSPEH